MTDDLTHLQDAMKAATPEPSKKDGDLALAMKNFDDFHDARQGSADPARPTSDRPTHRLGLSSGVFKMFHSLTTRGALAATTSIVAVGIGVLFYTQQGGTTFDLPKPAPVTNETPADTPAPQKAAEAAEPVAPVIEETAPDTRVRREAEATTTAPTLGLNLADSEAREDATLGLLAEQAAPAPAEKDMAESAITDEVIMQGYAAPPSAQDGLAFNWDGY